jgi:hypothetical protein
VGLSDADRARRSRAHRKGEHHLCDPARCSSADGVTVTEPVTNVTRDGVTLGPTGDRLWRELGGDKLTGGRRNLAIEACRIADRLDKLDRLLRGDAQDWLEIVETRGNPERQELVINAPLAESRQQATALKQIVAELRQSGGVSQAGQGGSILDQLAAKRAQRLANPAG